MSTDEDPTVPGGDEAAAAEVAVGDAAEERAGELADLASMQTDPGDGSVDAQPGEATEKQASTGASKGTGPLGLGSLDEGATGQVTGVVEREADAGAADRR